jgi:methyl-accepting chemotaxis protein
VKSHWLLLLSHTAVASIAAGATAVSFVAELASWGFLVTVAITTVAAAVACGVLTTRLRRGLAVVERAATTGEVSREVASGISEVDHAARRIGHYAQRWTEAIAGSQQQTRALESLLADLDRRSHREGEMRSGPAAQTLRQILRRITESVEAGLARILQSGAEIAQNTQDLASGAEDQTNALAKTTSCVEQLSVNIAVVTRNAESAQTAVNELHESVRGVSEDLKTLTRIIDRVQDHAVASERRIRGLGDRWQEINSIVETIATISSRTDLLALNASLESIRAGEHGRGFALVAEEVRKLAEQTAQATSEIAGLIESAQIETNESLAIMSHDCLALEEETQRLVKTGDMLQEILALGKESGSRVGEISHAADRQLQVARDLVSAIERLSDTTKAGRGCAEKTSWVARSLNDTAKQVHDVLEPLRSSERGNGRPSKPASAGESNPVTVSSVGLPDASPSAEQNTHDSWLEPAGDTAGLA